MNTISLGQMSHQMFGEICQKCKCFSPATRNLGCSHRICCNCSLAPIGKQSRRCPLCEKNIVVSAPIDTIARPRKLSNSSDSAVTNSGSSSFSSASPTIAKNFDFEPELAYLEQVNGQSPDEGAFNMSPEANVANSPYLVEPRSPINSLSPVNFEGSPFQFFNGDDFLSQPNPVHQPTPLVPMSSVVVPHTSSSLLAQSKSSVICSSSYMMSRSNIKSFDPYSSDQFVPCSDSNTYSNTEKLSSRIMGNSDNVPRLVSNSSASITYMPNTSLCMVPESSTGYLPDLSQNYLLNSSSNFANRTSSNLANQISPNSVDELLPNLAKLSPPSFMANRSQHFENNPPSSFGLHTMRESIANSSPNSRHYSFMNPLGGSLTSKSDSHLMMKQCANSFPMPSPMRHSDGNLAHIYGQAYIPKPYVHSKPSSTESLLTHSPQTQAVQFLAQPDQIQSPLSQCNSEPPQLATTEPVDDLSSVLQGSFEKCQHNINGEKMKSYCFSCRILYCNFCFDEHPDHETVPLSHPLIGQILVAQSNSLTHRQTQISASLNKVSDNIRQLQTIGAKSESEVNQAFNELASLVETRRATILKGINDVKTFKVSQLSEQKIILQSAKESLQNVSSALRANIDDTKDIGTKLAIKNLVEDELQASQGVYRFLRPMEDPVLSFMSDAVEIASKVVKFGKIVTDSSPKSSQLIGVNMKIALLNRPCSVSIICRDLLGERQTKGGEEIKAFLFTGETELRIELTVVDFDNGKYRIFFCPKELTSPTIRVYLRDREIINSPICPRIMMPSAYPDFQDDEISFGNTYSYGQKLERPWGIHCDKDGTIYASDRMHHFIHVFNADLTFSHRFGGFGYYPGRLNRPAGVTVNNKGHIIVADKDNHRIQIFSFEGTLLHFFGGRGTNDGEFFYPWGIDVNSEGQILVSDTRNHRVQLFDQVGKCLATVGGPNQKTVTGILEAPRGVKFGPNGSIYVSDFNLHHIVLIENFASKNPRFVTFGGNYQEVLRDFYKNHKCNNETTSRCITSPENFDVEDHIPPPMQISYNPKQHSNFPHNGMNYQNNSNGSAYYQNNYHNGTNHFHNQQHNGTNYYNNQRNGNNNYHNNHHNRHHHGNRKCNCTNHRNEHISYEELRSKLTLFRPQGMTLDWNGNLLVTDSRKSRIKVFTPDGKLIHTINLTQNHPTLYDSKGKVIDNTEKPVDIAVSPSGVIYVMEQQYEMIKVIQ